MYAAFTGGSFLNEGIIRAHNCYFSTPGAVGVPNSSPSAPFESGASEIAWKTPKVRFSPNFGHPGWSFIEVHVDLGFFAMVPPHFALQNHFITGGFG